MLSVWTLTGQLLGSCWAALWAASGQLLGTAPKQILYTDCGHLPKAACLFFLGKFVGTALGTVVGISLGSTLGIFLGSALGSS